MPTRAVNVGKVPGSPGWKQQFSLLTHKTSFSKFVTEYSSSSTDENT